MVTSSVSVRRSDSVPAGARVTLAIAKQEGVRLC
jgi:hypothetical protein